MSNADEAPKTEPQPNLPPSLDLASGKAGAMIARLETFGLWSRLLQLQKPAAIVADETLLTAMSGNGIVQGARRISVRDVENGRLPTPLTGPYFIVTEEDEFVVKQRLRTLLTSRGIRAEIYGAMHDLVPMVLADDNTLERAGLEAKWESYATARSLIIACTPRSGSQFLARKLHENGIGAPREHIRPAMIALFNAADGPRSGATRFEPFMAGLVHHARRNGVFATKLISHFIRDLEECLSDAEWASFNDFTRRARILYLLRSNKLLQGLSRDRAKSTQHYHVFADDKRAAYRDLSEGWTYDFARIFREVRMINKEEAYLMDWLRRLVDPSKRVPVIYETMDVEAVVEITRAALCAPKNTSSVSLPTILLRDELTETFVARFREDYR